MHKISLLCAVAVTASLLHAQNPCSIPSNLATLDPFTASHYLGSPNPLTTQYNGHVLFSDIVVDAPITISQIDMNLYDDGSANPNQIGQTAMVFVHTCPTTRAGNEQILPGPGSPWTTVATGTVTVGAFNAPSPAVFPTPFTLQPGSYGLAVQVWGVGQTGQGTPATLMPLHPLVVLTTSVPGIPLSAADQFLSISNTVSSRDAFFAGVGANHAINMDIHYTPAANAGYYSEYGEGCYNLPESYYEHFMVPPGPNGTFDLSNTGIQMIFTGSAYTVTPAAPTLVPGPYTPVVNASGASLGDDDISAPITLPFTLNYPGGSTTQITVGSNGYVFFDGTATAAGPFYDNVAAFMSGPPRVSPFWGDPDPSAATGSGSVNFDADPAGQFVYITWDQVQEWNVPTQLNTFQVVIFASGFIEYRYGSCGISAAPVLTGWTPGGGVTDPGSIDLTASLPFITGDGSLPLRLTMDARPVIGTTFNFVTEDIHSGTTAGFLFLGFGSTTPVPLNAIGMPDCFQHMTPFVTRFLGVITPGQATANTPVTLPNQAAFVGARVFGQSATVTPGLNQAGFLSSNGMCAHVGAQ